MNLDHSFLTSTPKECEGPSTLAEFLWLLSINMTNTTTSNCSPVIKHHTTKMYGGMDVKLRIFLTLALVVSFMLQLLHFTEEWGPAHLETAVPCLELNNVLCQAIEFTQNNAMLIRRPH